MLSELLASDQLLALEHSIRHGDSVLIEELWNSPKALVIALAQKASGKNYTLRNIHT